MEKVGSVSVSERSIRSEHETVEGEKVFGGVWLYIHRLYNIRSFSWITLNQRVNNASFSFHIRTQWMYYQRISHLTYEGSKHCFPLLNAISPSINTQAPSLTDTLLYWIYSIFLVQPSLANSLKSSWYFNIMYQRFSFQVPNAGNLQIKSWRPQGLNLVLFVSFNACKYILMMQKNEIVQNIVIASIVPPQPHLASPSDYACRIPMMNLDSWKVLFKLIGSEDGVPCFKAALHCKGLSASRTCLIGTCDAASRCVRHRSTVFQSSRLQIKAPVLSQLVPSRLESIWWLGKKSRAYISPCSLKMSEYT